jgi:DNA repair protein RecO (recombination protein O)
MGTSRSYQAHAVVLKQSKFGEFDKILTIYCSEFGKMRTVARGACRPGSKLGGNVEPLTYSLLMLARGRNLDIVTQSQCIDGFAALKADLWRTSCALYILDLVDSFTVQNSENTLLFNLLIDTLHRLNEEDDDSEILLRYFELNLLHYLGYRPQLSRCIICNSLLRSVVNYFNPGLGGVICPNCRENDFESKAISVNALKVLRLWQNCDYTTAKRVRLKPILQLELEQEMQGYIRCILQRELKSMIWLQNLKREMKGGGVDKTNRKN